MPSMFDGEITTTNVSRSRISPCSSGVFRPQRRALDNFDTSLPIYISTNVASDKSEFASLESKFKVYYISNLLDDIDALDKNELALFDQGLCTRSVSFIGNFFSSFSRSIAEFREAEGMPYDFW